MSETVKYRVVALCTKEGITAAELEKKLFLANGFANDSRRHKATQIYTQLHKLTQF